jgi:hypothetical protein
MKQTCASGTGLHHARTSIADSGSDRVAEAASRMQAMSSSLTFVLNTVKSEEHGKGLLSSGMIASGVFLVSWRPPCDQVDPPAHAFCALEREGSSNLTDYFSKIAISPETHRLVRAVRLSEVGIFISG